MRCGRRSDLSHNTEQTIDRIIELLEAVRQRPQMYLGELEHERATVFLYGFQMSLRAVNEQVPGFDLLKAAYTKRGWHFNALGGVPDMMSKGLSSEGIVHEILSAEIDAWKALRLESASVP